MITELSNGISKIMLPLYDEFAGFTTQDGKIMGHYSVLKFPEHSTWHQVFKKPLPLQEDDSELGPYQRVSYRELSNRVQEKEKREMHYSSISESKIHQLLDQNEAGQYAEDSYDDRYSSELAERKRLEKAKKHYERVMKEQRSGKRYKKRFKDKNRPKKAKSAYNLFVEDVVPRIKAENPSFSAPDLVRAAAKLYNQMTEEEKVPYQQRYLIDKERFERERESYFRKHPEMDYRLDSRQRAYAQQQQGRYRQ